MLYAWDVGCCSSSIKLGEECNFKLAAVLVHVTQHGKQDPQASLERLRHAGRTELADVWEADIKEGRSSGQPLPQLVTALDLTLQ